MNCEFVISSYLDQNLITKGRKNKKISKEKYCKDDMYISTFEHYIKMCLTKTLVDLLNDDQELTLLQLVLCNKNLRNLFQIPMLTNKRFNVPTILKWKKQHYIEYVRKIVINPVDFENLIIATNGAKEVYTINDLLNYDSVINVTDIIFAGYWYNHSLGNGMHTNSFIIDVFSNKIKKIIFPTGDYFKNIQNYLQTKKHLAFTHITFNILNYYSHSSPLCDLDFSSITDLTISDRKPGFYFDLDDYNYYKLFYKSFYESFTFPTSLSSLNLTCFDIPIHIESFSTNLTSLNFGNHFNQLLTMNTLPGSLKTLIFGDSYDQQINENVLPKNLEYLKFGKSFNSYVYLPEKLTTLVFDIYHKFSIDPDVSAFNFSDKVVNLDKLGNLNKFNQLISLPDSLLQIYFGFSFNQELVNIILPCNLKILHFGYHFNKPLFPGSLPHDLRKLVFGDLWDHALYSNILPPNLDTLYFGNQWSHPLTTGLFPESLTSLTFGNSWNHPLQIDILPKYLITLVFGDAFNQPLIINSLPKTLKSVTFGKSFNQELKCGILPFSLKQLVFGEMFNRKIHDDVFPNNLLSLCFGSNFCMRLKKKHLPSTLLNLRISKYYPFIRYLKIIVSSHTKVQYYV